MKRIFDLTGEYKPKENERVVRGNAAFFADVRYADGFDAVVAPETLKERLAPLGKKVSFVKPKQDVKPKQGGGK